MSAAEQKTTASRGSIWWLIALGAIVVLGAAIRLSQAGQSLIADEVWSYTGVTLPDFGSMLDYVQGDGERTPPLFTILAWLAARVSDSASVLRLPSIVAGILTIPLVYGIGQLTLGRRVALMAAALAALSPFLIWYSVELRAYSLVTMFAAASTLLLLIAVERRRWPWWAGYALVTCAAMYTHYTAVYVLLAQFLWAVALHPASRRHVLLAAAAAAVAYVPWIPSALDDFDAPSQATIDVLAPLGFHDAVDFAARMVLGHPAVGLRSFYGLGPEVLLFAGIGLAVVGLVARAARGWAIDRRQRENVILLVMLALAAPVGVAFVSLVSSDQFLPRNLSTSAPGTLVLLAAVPMAGTLMVRLVSTVLVVGAFAFGAFRSTEPRFQRLDYDAAAAFIDATAGPEDVVLDSGLFPVGTPLIYTLDINFDRPHETIDGISPEEVMRSLTEAAGARLYLVGPPLFVAANRSALGLDNQEPTEVRTFEALLPLTVQVFSIPHTGGEGSTP